MLEGAVRRNHPLLASPTPLMDKLSARIPRIQSPQENAKDTKNFLVAFFSHDAGFDVTRWRGESAEQGGVSLAKK